MTDRESALVLEAQRGDRGAFEEVVRRTSRLLFSRLYLETGDPHLAEDLLQDTYLQAYRSLGTLSEPGNLRAWLLAIARNVTADAARRQTRQKRAAPPRAGPETLAAVPGPGPTPGEEAERAELRKRVVSVLRSLPEEYHLPLALRYIAGADHETIRTQLGLTNGSLRGLLHRGLKMLRDRLGPEFGDRAGP
jgi:RNA polymerase sigma-70 factor (ECF subfamily)